MQKLLLLTFVLATLGVRAQDNPWSKEPAKKEVLNADEWDRTSNIPVYLKIDTLHRNSQPDERDRVSRMWYGTDAIGYGYADKQGRPYGVWKYYTRSGNAYQLLCEGFYTALKPEGLIVDPEIQKQFASASDKKNKEDFLAAL